ncbi:uncharacterized protein HMPREF1541_05570 [Cyphellophora europaea CBS 101466]|uniref:Uncharacterized protein n=1 Tax=Cyphellophora europaea (strain CBS 101466) TaxID=1220924 RepID=W2RSB7_CYPE1|nr:uncharacterized protein HMPREF1541_05570 [Cyphellophora europaea CBS 101466]ETN39347.1 hypothetical protein HMPREF1541_05570 [Cyphellophora europaea CBS 101466]
MHRHSHSHSHSHTHGGADHDASLYPAQEEYNLLGALIFFAYILAALVLTSIIGFDLLKLPRKGTNAKTPSPGRYHSIRVTFLVLTATLSFATLSFQMLSVLIQSYTRWTVTHGSVDASMLYTGLFPGPTNLYDYALALSHSIWHWATTSTLFGDFATAILASPARRIWTRAVLYYSLCVNIWMSDAGHQHRIPHLSLYFLLAQILPVSFTQQLFLLALELTRRNAVPGRQPDVRAPSQRRPAYFSYLALLVAYLLAVDTAAATNGRDSHQLHFPAVLPMVLFIRLLLFTPLFIPTLTHWMAAQQHQRWMPAPVTTLVFFFVIGWQSKTAKDVLGLGWRHVLEAVHEDPAVRALGYDLVLAIVGAAAWWVLESLEKSPVQDMVKEGVQGKAAKSEGEVLQGKVDEKLRTEADGCTHPPPGTGEGLQGQLDNVLRARGQASGIK